MIDAPTHSVRRKIVLAALTMSASVFLSRILGFARDATIAYTLGAGSETDAYFAAFTLPDLMNYFLAGGTLSITFLPLYTKRITGGDAAAGDRLVSVVLTNFLSVLLALLLLAEVFTPGLIGPLFPGFDATQLDRTVELTRIVLPAQLFFFSAGVLGAVLMAHERFLAVAAAPVVYNLCIIILGVALAPSMGVAGFSVGALVGAAAGPLLLTYLGARKLVHFRARLAFRDRDFLDYLKLTLPLMIGMTLLTVDEWLGRYFGSSLESGTITWLNNARRLMLVPMGLIGQAAGLAALPFLSKLVAEKRESEMAATLTSTIRGAAFLASLCAVFVAMESLPLVVAIYERGRFTRYDSEQTAAILLFYSPAIVFWATQVVAVRGFYARRDTLKPMVVGTIVTIVAVPIYWVLCRAHGAVGLAGATSIGIACFALATLLTYQRVYGGVSLVGVALGAFKGGLAGTVGLLGVLIARSVIGQLALVPALASWAELALAFLLFGSFSAPVIMMLGGPEAALARRIWKRLRDRAQRAQP